MNNEPIYIIINLDGVRIKIRLQSGATLLPLVPKMTGSWRLAKCTSPVAHKTPTNSVAVTLDGVVALIVICTCRVFYNICVDNSILYTKKTNRLDT